MKFLTFNIESGRPNSSWQADPSLALGAAARQLGNLAPDVVGFQEVRRGSGEPRHLLADCGPMQVVFAPAQRRFFRVLRKLTGRKRFGYGIALASRYPIEAWKIVNMPTLHNPIVARPQGRGWHFRVDVARVAILAVIEAEVPVVLGVTHVSTRKPDNLIGLAKLEREIERFARERGLERAPRILMGDFNTRIDAVEENVRMEVLARANTYPDSKPWMQIDHIVGRGFFPDDAAKSVHFFVSDHRGLFADLALE